MVTEPSHPGPASIELPATVLQAMIDHARAEYPNEMCGVIVGDKPAAESGQPLRWEPTRNRAASPLRYEIHPDDLLWLTIATEQDDEEFWAQIDGAVEHARGFVERIRSGDVKHDPLGDAGCPTWCDLYSMCRVRRS